MKKVLVVLLLLLPILVGCSLSDALVDAIVSTSTPTPPPPPTATPEPIETLTLQDLQSTQDLLDVLTGTHTPPPTVFYWIMSIEAVPNNFQITQEINEINDKWEAWNEDGERYLFEAWESHTGYGAVDLNLRVKANDELMGQGNCTTKQITFAGFSADQPSTLKVETRQPRLGGGHHDLTFYLTCDPETGWTFFLP